MGTIDQLCDYTIGYLRQGWTQGTWARNEEGHPTASYSDETAVCWCLGTAIGMGTNEMVSRRDWSGVVDGFYRKWSEVNLKRPYKPGVISRYNDAPHRTVEEVIASVLAVKQAFHGQPVIERT